jgi:hypothetical protein
MVGTRVLFGLVLLVPTAVVRDGGSQTSAQPPVTDRPYTVPVDEVSLTFDYDPVGILCRTLIIGGKPE